MPGRHSTKQQMTRGEESRRPTMLTDRPTPGPEMKPQRVLACQLCQQRKVKCDRKFPCANCVRFKSQCVPATLPPRQRRRRFAERELLARIRHYEAVLEQHEISFEPLHPPTTTEKLSESHSHSLSHSHSPETLIDGGSPDTARTELSVSSQGKAAKPRATYGYSRLHDIFPDG
jgi:hypothetical protein